MASSKDYLDFIMDQLSGLDGVSYRAMMGEYIIYFRGKQLEFALTHSDSYGETNYSFVNGQYTSDGGTHLSAFKEGVLKGINEFSGRSFKADAIRDGMIGAVAVKVREPIFESQTKNKLGNTDVRSVIVPQVATLPSDTHCLACRKPGAYSKMRTPWRTRLA